MKKIPLTGKRGKNKCAFVDNEDFEKLSQYNWCFNGRYIVRKGRRGTKEKRTVSLHRQIMNVPEGMCTDHKDHNTLNNQKSNLRICTNAQNQYNQKVRSGGASKFKGVAWNKPKNKWQAYIRFNKKQIYLGLFVDEIDAARSYDEAAKKYHKEFASINHVK